MGDQFLSDMTPARSSIRLNQIELSSRQTLALLVDLSAFSAPELRQLERTLPNAEEQQFAVMQSAADRSLRSATRAVLRLVLGQLTGFVPDMLCFGAGPQGKPFLLGMPSFRINVSHSGAYALLAFALDAEIGCDIEQANRIDDIKALSEVVLHPDEAQVVLGLTGVAAQDAFMRCWVRKEAVLKAMGVGLSVEPTRIKVGLSEPVTHHRIEEGPATDVTFNLHCLRPARGYLAAVASPHPDCQWRLLQL